jgi:hypothetical protein
MAMYIAIRKVTDMQYVPVPSTLELARQLVGRARPAPTQLQQSRAGTPPSTGDNASAWKHLLLSRKGGGSCKALNGAQRGKGKSKSCWR